MPVKFYPYSIVEEEFFTNLWCDNCQKKADCSIIFYAFQVSDPGHPKEWYYDSNGQPACSAFMEKEGG